ncbi:hypothetical protein QBC33DRAFT_533841 [Phialemonium atrogriseum]|uniref:Uncharacterized protein n=1 Tax=Phialemonium atrogriseum TaxID=1093897 RepID=A0AAJ0C2P4_9PEZI|nr:uncharacterized protein QBC33DRAFT_533841 [Phialemonium atrogriseum]KAK1768835.1 hypothetical protein QBC33DRAFT_533841 [Phialemonium atrogriseum]
MSEHLTSMVDFDEAGLRFAKMAFKQLYGRDANPQHASDFVPLYQYNTFRGKYGECEPWEHTCVSRPLSNESTLTLSSVDGYGITFDHLVSPADDDDPETLMINTCDPSNPDAARYLKLDLGRYSAGPEPVVLLVPRCCQLRRGTTDRERINNQAKEAREYLCRQAASS